MNQFVLVLMVLIVITTLIGLVWTYRLGQYQKTVLDPDVSEKVKEQPIVRNPIFLAYAVFALVTLGFVLYVIFSYGV